MDQFITVEAKRQHVRQRIAQLEMEIYAYEVEIVEFSALVKRMGERTDASTHLSKAQIGVQSSGVRLGVLRDELRKLDKEAANGTAESGDTDAG